MEKSRKDVVIVRSIKNIEKYELDISLNGYKDGSIEFDITDIDHNVNLVMAVSDGASSRYYIKRIVLPAVCKVLKDICPLRPSEIADITAALYRAVTHTRRLKGAMTENYHILTYHALVRLYTKYVPTPEALELEHIEKTICLQSNTKKILRIKNV